MDACKEFSDLANVLSSEPHPTPLVAGSGYFVNSLLPPDPVPVPWIPSDDCDEFISRVATESRRQRVARASAVSGVHWTVCPLWRSDHPTTKWGECGVGHVRARLRASLPFARGNVGRL